MPFWTTIQQLSVRFRGALLCLALLVLSAVSFKGYSQDLSQDKDSLVRLISAKAIQLTEINGAPFRVVHGPARFMHNNAYLLCDSAAWDVNSNVIDAMGHVQIIQQDTHLESEFATYLADENLVQFRGTEVKLYNKKGDQLKTQFLDYNTADSVATFYNGGAMRSAKGDIVEGLEGIYDVSEKMFMFNDDVCMYSDSIFVASEMAEYHSNQEVAIFGENTTAWKGRDTLFSNNAEYGVRKKILVLKTDNYIATKDQELWAGWIDYHRETGNAELYDNVQVRDQAQSAIIMGDKGVYVQRPMLVYMTDNAVAGMYSEEKTGVDSLTNRPIYKRDTLFLGGDTLKMWQVPMNQVDSAEVLSAKKRRELADLDPMVEIDRQNREFLAAYRRNKENAGKLPPPPPSLKSKKSEEQIPDQQTVNDGPPRMEISGNQKPERNKLESQSLDSAFVSRDSVLRDSLSVNADSLAAPPDTSAVTFMSVYHKVKLFRSDLRGVCDSLIYTTLDSIARFYKNPALWNEEKNQFTADSIQLSVRNNAIYKANLIENAFIISREDSLHFHQIKSTEMVAYFKDNDVYRFDALGGVQAMIFLAERDSTVTLMNQKECKLLTAKIANQTIERVRYIQDIKSDVHPTYGLPVDKMRLRDFKWRGDEMPHTRNELTTRKVRPSNRGFLRKKTFPHYFQTRDFFPKSYDQIMEIARSVTAKIREEDQAELERQRQKQARDAEAKRLSDLDEEVRIQQEAEKREDGPVMIYNKKEIEKK